MVWMVKTGYVNNKVRLEPLVCSACPNRVLTYVLGRSLLSTEDCTCSRNIQKPQRDISFTRPSSLPVLSPSSSAGTSLSHSSSHPP